MGLALRATFGGTTPLVLVAGILAYVAALDAIEPLAQEVDHPTMLNSYPVASGLILVRHLVAPVVDAARRRLGWASPMRSTRRHVLIQVGAITLVSGAFAAVAGASISVVSEVVGDSDLRCCRPRSPDPGS